MKWMSISKDTQYCVAETHYAVLLHRTSMPPFYLEVNWGPESICCPEAVCSTSPWSLCFQFRGAYPQAAFPFTLCSSKFCSSLANWAWSVWWHRSSCPVAGVSLKLPHAHNHFTVSEGHCPSACWEHMRLLRRRCYNEAWAQFFI